jgi:histidinol phosphatase-like enzyme
MKDVNIKTIQSGHGKTVIFDLDGTLANIDDRRKLSTKPNGKLDWDVFFDPDNIQLDKPNAPVVKMAQLFAQDGFKIVIFSGRNDRSFFTTKSWLVKHRVPFHQLIMRPDKFKEDSWPIAKGNPATKEMKFMPDEILKKHMLDLFVDIDDVFLVVDDRNKVVDMWRDLGLNTFQVAPGNF